MFSWALALYVFVFPFPSESMSGDLRENVPPGVSFRVKSMAQFLLQATIGQFC